MTTLQLREIRQRNLAGQSDVLIARAIGVDRCSVRRHRISMGLPAVGVKGPKPCNYIVYDAKTDDLLAMGTPDECAKALGLKNNAAFHQMVSKVRAGIVKKYVVMKDDEA